MNAASFVAKWKQADLKERSAAQEHFLDLCRLVGHPTPAEADPAGAWFCFERGAAKQDGGEGWADVWKQGFFGWEYKGRRKDLEAAHKQLLLYRESLENPPLLVVCDTDRFEIRTNFTGTATQVHAFDLDGLLEPRHLEILRHVFHAPDKLRPGATSESITRDAATRLGAIAQSMRGRGLDPDAVAHFLDRIVFCLFAEDTGLLPDGLFSRMLDKTRHDAPRFGRLLGQLFGAMATGGDFGLDTIRHFNGSLFNDDTVLELEKGELEAIEAAARLNWSAVDPSIFGTLFERGMDPAKRSQLGAHYTSRADIETLVDPVVMAPLRQEWTELQDMVVRLLMTGKKLGGRVQGSGFRVQGKSEPSCSGRSTESSRESGSGADVPVQEAPQSPSPSSPSSPQHSRPLASIRGSSPLSPARLRKARGEAESLLHQFLMRLHHVRVLDPACGSGNFLYVTLQKLKDLEKEVILFAREAVDAAFLPGVGPWQLHGIELSPYAHDLAQLSVWIGYLQWTRANGFQILQDPVLKPMKGNFQCRDAILDLSDPENPKAPDWPAVELRTGHARPHVRPNAWRALLPSGFSFQPSGFLRSPPRPIATIRRKCPGSTGWMERRMPRWVTIRPSRAGSALSSARVTMRGKVSTCSRSTLAHTGFSSVARGS